MAVLTNDSRFEKKQTGSIEGGARNMCEVLDKAEEKGRAEYRKAYKMLKGGQCVSVDDLVNAGINNTAATEAYEDFLEDV